MSLASVCLASAALAQSSGIAVIDLETLVRLHPNTASDKKLLEQTLKEFTGEKDAEREYNETVRSLQRQLTEQEMRMLKRTTAEIEEAVAGYAKAKQLQLVLQLPGEKLGAVSGVIYAAPPLNITTNIMKLMGINPVPVNTADATAAE
jgi:Skp family chaperone for outer membrane proteins